MWLELIGLIFSLAIILLSCELFTNGIEWMGRRLKVGDGVVGSIFSAVGTCLPETMIPVIAILFSNDCNNTVDIGIGAIAGAPFMLGTLALFITGMSVVICNRKRKTGMNIKVNTDILSRDLTFFIILYSVGISATFIPSWNVKAFIAAALVLFYFLYIYLTIKNDNISHSELESLLLSKYLNTRPRFKLITLQILLSLMGIIFGAHLFVNNIRDLSNAWGIPCLVLSLIITPIATELPEKFNSVLWISKGKDTLALGNITGAMVFQSCIPVAIGILATPWNLDYNTRFSAIMAIVSALLVLGWIRTNRKLSPLPLIAGGIFYLLFIASLSNII